MLQASSCRCWRLPHILPPLRAVTIVIAAARRAVTRAAVAIRRPRSAGHSGGRWMIARDALRKLEPSWCSWPPASRRRRPSPLMRAGRGSRRVRLSPPSCRVCCGFNPNPHHALRSPLSCSDRRRPESRPGRGRPGSTPLSGSSKPGPRRRPTSPGLEKNAIICRGWVLAEW